MNQSKQVVVVGAGYAGVMAANRILAARLPGVAVTVINPRADFVERIRLHQFATGSGAATIPLTEVLDPAARIRIDTVERIDARSVLLGDGDVVDFDYLVYAVGSVADRRDHALAHTHTVAVLEDADRLRTRLRELSDGAVVTVVGGGLTGIETAVEIAEQRPTLSVQMISAGPPAAQLPAAGRTAIVRALTRNGVTLREGVRVQRVTEGRVELDDGSGLDSDCTVWAGAFAVPDLARRSGLPVDEAGRLRTDSALVCLDNPTIVGVGDAVAAPDEVAGHVRMSCQAALPLGVHGADTVLALLNGETPTPLSLGFVAQCISLGRRSALVQAVRPDDSPRRFALRGRLAAVVKEQICRYTVKYVRAGSYRGPAGPARVQVADKVAS
ncbi:pyridine nucleotide-disulfide oxidoreductase [Rhodococcus spelaei]|uniref:Pyridine nucleotide-disulfide oxidoreductase n=1 Tax=Rhodococcus spelaei TaxID=2546320 RepID=A0A541B8C1_9NOCA|nr:FAD-dependent oxidoreductase [Rhodococcus spelaei]TQF68577.1 pyridine nucleotide-disulfide oxidoreductase [Rhodococcus spelaei]